MHVAEGSMVLCIIFDFMKRRRHNAILELVREGEITSQDDLMRGLKARNIKVSQSTLSRDIQALRLAKSGGVYTVVETEPVKASEESPEKLRCSPPHCRHGTARS